MADISYTKPFLKWVGGKTQIIDNVINLFPNKIYNYYEPFIGGGSVLLALLSLQKANKITIEGRIYANDLNKNLINLYKNIQTNCDELISELEEIINNFEKCEDKEVNRKASNLEEALTSPESYYYWIRIEFNKLLKDQTDANTIKASAMFIFLNKTCFRGVYRMGPNGFNVPYGNYKNPGIYDKNELKEISTLIKDVIFSCGDYKTFLDIKKMVKSKDYKNNFIYLDPPYAPENDKSFVKYNLEGFNLEEHKKLFELCKKIKEKEIKFVMSNSKVKLITDEFNEPEYKIQSIECKRSINSKKPGSKTQEVLITY